MSVQKLPGADPRSGRGLALLALAALTLPVRVADAADQELANTEPALQLVEVASEIGIDFVSLTGDGSIDYILEANGNGVAVLDYDHDGDPDLLLVSGSTLEILARDGGSQLVALYRNDGTGRFEDVTRRSGLERRGWGMGACFGDYDGDGFLDLYVTAYGPNLLFRSNGDGTFIEVGDEAKVADAGWSHGCAFGDYDGDGLPDLYVTNNVVFGVDVVPARGPDTPCGYRGFRTFCGPMGLEPQADSLYRNLGDGRFELRQPPIPASYGLGVVFSDLDGDGRTDYFVANDSQANFLFRSLGNGELEDVAPFAGVALNELANPQATMGIAVGDYDNDSDMDLFVTNFSEDYNTLYRNNGRSFFADISVPSGVAQASMTRLAWGVLFVDLDNDGWQDLFIANGHVYEDAESFGFGSSYRQTNQVLMNSRTGRFKDVSQSLGSGLAVERSSRGAAVIDLEQDGDLDLVVVNMNEPPEVLRNDPSHSHRWLRVKVASAPGQGDDAGLRAIATLRGETRTSELIGGGSYLSQSEPFLHFGLASADRVSSLEVRLPGDRRRRYTDLPTDTVFVIPAQGPSAAQGEGS